LASDDTLDSDDGKLASSMYGLLSGWISINLFFYHLSHKTDLILDALSFKNCH
jgi:hypothetical protein